MDQRGAANYPRSRSMWDSLDLSLGIWFQSFHSEPFCLSYSWHLLKNVGVQYSWTDQTQVPDSGQKTHGLASSLSELPNMGDNE